MKKFALIVALALGSAAHADHSNWAEKLAKYKDQVQRVSNTMLLVHNGFYTGAALTACSMSAAVVGAAFISDTAPVTNVISETIANSAAPDYKTYEALYSWDTLAQMGRGLIGGAPIAMVESLQFVVLWLGGKEDQSFDQVKKVYASTLATANSVFSRESQCMMNLSKVLLARREMVHRNMLQGPPRQTDTPAPTPAPNPAPVPHLN